MSRAALDLNLIRTFVAVAEAGGFTAAADMLGIARPQVSLQVARLEKALGARLFERTTRRVALAEPGQRLHERCAPLLHALVEATDTEEAARHNLQGRLRIAAPVDHAALVLAPIVADFALLHPQLEIELRASDKVGDLIAEGIDVAFRLGWLRDSSVRASKLGDFEQGVFASPGYLWRAGLPRHPQDLAAHRWIAFTLLRSPLTWQFRGTRGQEVRVRMKAHLRTDSSGVLRALLCSGAGVSCIGVPHVRNEARDGALVRLLPRWALSSGGIYAVFPPGQHIAARSQALVDFVRQRLNAPPLERRANANG